MKKNPNYSGFTLIELVVVMMLISIIIAVLVVRIGTYSYWRQESFIRQLSDTLIFLHHQAVSDQAFYRMEFDVEKNVYTIATMRPEYESSAIETADPDQGNLTLELSAILSPSMNSGTLIPPPSFPSLGKPVEFPPEIVISDIRTPRGKEKGINGEKPYLLFSPRGFSEFAVLHLMAMEEEPITILVNPFTGNTTIFREYKDFEWTYGRNKKRPSLLINSRAFTLIEVVIAVLILSSALVTLLGLQSSILKRALRDEEKQQAMLLARTIISAIEVNNRDIDVQEETTTVDSLLEKLQLNLKDENNEENIKKFDFMARLKVENVGVKDVGDNLMKSVSLSIYAKDSPLVEGMAEDAFEVVYLIPLEDQ